MHGPSPRPAAQEWRENWTVVMAGLVGISFLGVPSLSMGLFMAPLHEAFGWGRAEISAGISLGAVPTILLSPFLGAFMDRHGARTLAIPGLIITGLAVAACSLTGPAIWTWYLVWGIFALGGCGISQTVWTAPVSRRFEHSRGLALGVTVTGVAITQVIAPPLSQWLVETRGWREAFVWLGIGWGGTALVFVALFFFDTVGRRTSRKARPKAAGAVPARTAASYAGLSPAQALRDGALQRIAISALLTMFFGFALIVHQVPILVEAGVSLRTAALLSSVTGAAAFVGKLATGWMMDRWHAAQVGGLTLALPAVAFALLVAPFRSPALIVVSMIIVGYAAGSKLQIAAHLTGVYGGLRNFGAIFGTMSSLLAIGSGLGPIAAGAVYDAKGSYWPILAAGIGGSLISGFLLLGLGPYPKAAGSEPG